MPIIKQKYDINNIYKDYSSSLYVLRERVVNGHKLRVKQFITVQEFRKVVYTYFEIKFEELMRFGLQSDLEVGLISGLFCLRKKVQTRSYHTIKDNEESFKQGKLVKKRIPIFDDYYTKILWMMKKPSFGRLRVKFGHAPNKARKELQKKIGFDSFKLEETKKKKR